MERTLGFAVAVPIAIAKQIRNPTNSPEPNDNRLQLKPMFIGFSQLAAQAPVAMRYIINAINHGLDMPFAEGEVFEATLFGLIASTDDMREGTRAFLEKRKADFKGK